METNYKITIPKPCHEDWNKMTPDQTGRFCNSCAKSVVDFTNMKAPEIQEFFIKNQGKSVCGRFKNEQLDSIIIQIPREVLYTQVQFHKMFMLALLISMGTTLFSCQNANGNKQKIDGVEVVDSAKEIRTMGEPMPEKVTEEEHLTGDTTYSPDKTKKETKTTIVTKTAPPMVTNGLVAIDPKITNFIAEKKDIYNLNEVEKQPEYPKGIWEFYEYVKHNFKVSEEDENITKKLFVTFTINTDGSLSDIKIIRGINDRLDAEALRVLKSCPKWIPGEQKGEKVNVRYSIPLQISAKE